jgi:hypothetical protein
MFARYRQDHFTVATRCGGNLMLAVFVGRPTPHGVAAGSGAVASWPSPSSCTMMQIGMPDIRGLGPHQLMWKDEHDWRGNNASATEHGSDHPTI